MMTDKKDIKEKKKLMLVLTSLECGGAERVITHLINYLNKESYKILLVLLEDKGAYAKELRPGVRSICLKKKTRWDFFRVIIGLRRVMSSYNPDIILSFDSYVNIITQLTKLFYREKPNMILSERNFYPIFLSKKRLWRIKRHLMAYVYRQTDNIIAVSGAIKRALEDDFKIRPGTIKTIYNPVPIEKVNMCSQEEVKHPFFEKDNAQIVIGVGRLVEPKRFDRLLKAFSLLVREEKRNNIYLLIIGDGEKKRELKNLATKLGLNGRVDLVGYKNNPYAWMAKADVFVLSSDTEGFPNVILEAMACGTPVISIDCMSGPSELITHGKNGILVAPKDERALVSAIKKILDDEDFRKRLSIEGRNRARDFSIEKILPQYEDVFIR